MRVDLINNRGVANLGHLLEEDFKTCAQFDIAVAFISEHSLELLNVFLKKNKTKLRTGRLLISIYNSFNSKRVLEQLMNLDRNSGKIQVRISSNEWFHWKYYHFEFLRKQHVYIGSANFTKDGLQDERELVCRIKLDADKHSSSNIYKAAFNKEWVDSLAIKDFPISAYQQTSLAKSSIKQSSEIKRFLSKGKNKQITEDHVLQRVKFISGYFSKTTEKIISKNQSHWDKNGWNYFACSGKAEYNSYSTVNYMFLIEKYGGVYKFHKVKKMAECDIETPDGRYFIAYKYIGRSKKETQERRDILEGMGIMYRSRSFSAKALGKKQSDELLKLLS